MIPLNDINRNQMNINRDQIYDEGLKQYLEKSVRQNMVTIGSLDQSLRIQIKNQDQFNKKLYKKKNPN